MRIKFDEMPRKVHPKLMRMFLQMRMEMLLKEKFGSTDDELELHKKMEELGELEDIEGYHFGVGFDWEGLFMVETEIEEFPGEALPVRMQCN